MMKHSKLTDENAWLTAYEVINGVVNVIRWKWRQCFLRSRFHSLCLL